MTLKKIVFEGILTKRGFWNPDFKERYFVLTEDGNLQYFEEQSQKHHSELALGVIHLGCKFTLASVAAANIHDSTEIILTVSNIEHSHARSYVMQATTKLAQQQWIIAIKKILDKKEIYVPPKPEPVHEHPVKHSVLYSMGKPRRVAPKKWVLWPLI